MFGLSKAMVKIRTMRKAYGQSCQMATARHSFLSKMPFIDLSETTVAERHWKIKEDCYLSLLSSDFTTQVLLNSNSEEVWVPMELGGEDGYATFILRIQGFMMGSAGVYDYDAALGTNAKIALSKRGIFCDYYYEGEDLDDKDTIELLSLASMKTILSVDNDIRRSLKEWAIDHRDEALQFVAGPSGSEFSKAVRAYDETRSLAHFEWMEEARSDDTAREVAIEELTERFGFTETEIAAEAKFLRW